MGTLNNYMEGETGGMPNGYGQAGYGGLLDNPMLQIGLGLLANNNSANFSQNLGKGALQGLQNLQQSRQQGLEQRYRQDMLKRQAEQLEIERKKALREETDYNNQNSAIEAMVKQSPEQANAIRLDPKGAMKMLNPALNSVDPYNNLIYDKNGNAFLHNLRENDPTKALQPISINGAPLVGAKWSPELGYNMARQQARGEGSNKLTDKFPGVVTTETIGADSINQGNNPMPQQSPPRTQLRQPTPQGFPVISPPQQQQMDAKRKQILMQELQAEQQSLQSAADPAQQQAHQRNIQLLNGELGLAQPRLMANSSGISGIKVPTETEKALTKKQGESNIDLAMKPKIAEAESAATEKGKLVGKDSGASITRQDALTSVSRANALLDAGIYTGGYANLRSNAAKYTPFADKKRLSNTQEFLSEIGNTVVPRLQEFGGNDSNEEMRYLKGIMGGDITAEPAALKSVLKNVEDKIKRGIERSKNGINPDGTPKDSSILPRDAKMPSAPMPTGQKFDAMPRPDRYKGKTMRDDSTGKRYQSNGLQWKEVR